MNVLGVDVGGTGTKGAVIDTLTGAVVEPKHRLLTPKPATPQRLADTIAELRDHFDWRGPIGIGLPSGDSSRRGGVTAAHISDDWIGVDAQTFLGERLACPITLLNDADAGSGRGPLWCGPAKRRGAHADAGHRHWQRPFHQQTARTEYGAGTPRARREFDWAL